MSASILYSDWIWMLLRKCRKCQLLYYILTGYGCCGKVGNVSFRITFYLKTTLIVEMSGGYVCGATLRNDWVKTWSSTQGAQKLIFVHLFTGLYRKDSSLLLRRNEQLHAHNRTNKCACLCGAMRSGNKSNTLCQVFVPHLCHSG